MTSPADTALAFCRECLGWEDAYQQENDYVESPASDDGSAPCEGLHYTDLAAVLLAVRSWCDANGLTMVITSQRPPKFFRWRVQVSEHGYVLDNDPCHALLAACLEAARKLRAA